MQKLDFIEIKTAPNCNAAVIWLHGLGADGHDFVSIVPELNLPKQVGIHFVFPHAPVRPVTLNNGMMMRAWYDIKGMSLKEKEDQLGILESVARIDDLIEQIHEQGISYERIILAGFSQGGAMVLYTGLRFPHRLAGIMALSAYLPLSHLIADQLSEPNRKIPIFMAHGTQDTMVPIFLGQATEKFLATQGYVADWHTYPMDHGVCLEEVQDIGRWLRGIFQYE